MQEDVGLQSATDGEFRRGSWHMDFIYQLGRRRQMATERPSRSQFRNAEGSRSSSRPRRCSVGRQGRRCEHTIFGDDFAMLRDTVTNGDPEAERSPPVNQIYVRGGRTMIEPSASIRTWMSSGATIVDRLRRGDGLPGFVRSAARTCSSTT